MKNIRIYLGCLILIFGYAILTIGCKKKNEIPAPVQPGKSDVPKLTRYGSDTSNIAFLYLNGNLFRVTYVANGQPLPYDIIYVNGKPTKMIGYNGVTELSFDDSVVKKADVHADNGDLVSSATFSYDANNRLVSQTFFQQNTNVPQYIRYDYSFSANGDITTVSEFLRDIKNDQYHLFRTFKCTYDTHPNPLLGLNSFYIQFYALPASSHNITNVTVYDDKNAVILTAAYNFIYSGNGYPVSAERTLSQPGAVLDRSHISYSYQGM